MTKDILRSRESEWNLLWILEEWWRRLHVRLDDNDFLVAPGASPKSQTNEASFMPTMKNILIITCAAVSLLLLSCEGFEGATPIPHDKETFIGRWESKSGFILEIKASGMVDVAHNLGQGEPDYEKLSVKFAPRVIKDMLIKFKEGSTFEIVNSLDYAKKYTVDQQPSQENNQWKMVLNGVTFIKQ